VVPPAALASRLRKPSPQTHRHSVQVLLLLMPDTFQKPLKYLTIAGVIRDRIADGTYRPGQQLPASAALAKEHGVALMTVRQALGILQLEGAIEARHGAGTFVADGTSRSQAHRTRRVLLTEDDRVLCDIVATALR